MIKFLETGIENLIVHKIGNNNEQSIINREELLFDKKIEQPILINFFLKPFSSQFESYNFFHEVELNLNPVFKCCIDIFQKQNFIETSIKLSEYLISCSNHPNIKEGEFFVVKFDEVLFDNTYHEAIGLFKTENKEFYFDSTESISEIKLQLKNGISTNKLDKGCLILNTEEEKGFKVLVVGNTIKSSEAQYWKDNFLKIIEEKSDYHHTKEFMNIAKNFVTKQLNEEFEVSKADQIDYLNRSVDYFKTNDTFDKQEFEKQVFADENVIESFRTFDEAYRKSNELDMMDSFDISTQAVKKQAKVFKSVLKLDKNFHVYIHGDRNLIEQGVDPDGRKFYKLYFKEEE